MAITATPFHGCTLCGGSIIESYAANRSVSFKTMPYSETPFVIAPLPILSHQVYCLPHHPVQRHNSLNDLLHGALQRRRTHLFLFLVFMVFEFINTKYANLSQAGETRLHQTRTSSCTAEDHDPPTTAPIHQGWTIELNLPCPRSRLRTGGLRLAVWF